jgi:acyl carrier protein
MSEQVAVKGFLDREPEEETVYDFIRKRVEVMNGIPMTSISGASHLFDELMFTSLDLVELMTILEDKYEYHDPIYYESVEQIQTINDITLYAEKQIREKQETEE